jgi:hypothetical protein
MKAYRVCSGVNSKVIDATQKVVWMAMSLVNCAGSQNGGPAASNFENILTDPQ